MEFSELKKELKLFTFSQVRADEENYLEAVVSKEELAKLIPALEKLLGPPVVPESNDLPARLQAKIKDLGGVMGGQTLYAHSEADTFYFAMLWPWSNGNLITIKICNA